MRTRDEPRSAFLIAVMRPSETRRRIERSCMRRRILASASVMIGGCPAIVSEIQSDLVGGLFVDMRVTPCGAHCALRRSKSLFTDGFAARPICACEARTMRVFGVRLGLAYVRWGTVVRKPFVGLTCGLAHLTPAQMLTPRPRR